MLAVEATPTLPARDFVEGKFRLGVSVMPTLLAATAEAEEVEEEEELNV